MARFQAKFVKSLFEKTGDRSINNLYTGMGLSSKGKAVAMVGVAGYGTYSGITGYNEYKKDVMLQNTDPNIYAMQSTEADGVGYAQMYNGQSQAPVNVTSLDPLQVGGDLVFALHNLRHGG